MNKMRQWSILAGVGVLAVFGAGWFLLVSPQRAHATDLRAQAATQLLQEDRRALRGPKEQDGVDVGQVETFVEQVGSEEDVDSPRP